MAGDETVRGAIAGNPKTPAAVLVAFVQTGNIYINRIVAQNPAAPTLALERILSLDPELKTIVAKHLNAPVWLLEELARDDDEVIRGIVARNPATPSHVLDLLISDEGFIPGLLLEHPNLSQNALDFFANDESRWRRSEVLAHQNTPAHVRERVRLLEAIDDPVTPSVVLEQLADGPEQWIQRGIARHPNAPRSLLEAYARSRNLRTREAVASNRGTPPAILVTLAR